MIFLVLNNIGLPDFKIANLFTDMELLKEVQKIAINIIKSDPEFMKKENNIIGKRVNDTFRTIIL